MTDESARKPVETSAELPGGLPERQFGWWDVFVAPEDDPRGGELVRGEHAILVGYLRNQRLTLEMKCAGLDAAALARRSVPPSNLSLLGLVRHMAMVEQNWFRRVMAGESVVRHYRTEASPNEEFDGAVPDPEAVAEAFGRWRDEVAFAERFVAEARDLYVTGVDHGRPVELREVLVHMIEEYSRHNGHADFLRERIDGRVGQ
ncbi:DinB family protein [Yinghuangia soli]|uniref:DinB family protein n=1 Tax=Yinghuangia soli TaxID=2908204 RepID=A0AA41TZQ6_9ACTN|nr:DinB family protein [Yinghuangia soli]MCF2527550.1 DinB family protein [Yinghuangia soli]